MDEDEELRKEVARLQTGEDAISFFARHSSNTRVKLLYCNRVPKNFDDLFAPYDLMIVPEGKVNPEYFTISASGIVKVKPGELSEYISLVDWMHQSLMFRVLTSMTFFRCYIHRKMFDQWLINSRYEVYCRNRHRLKTSCFLAKPLFVEPLVSMHALIHEVEEVRPETRPLSRPPKVFLYQDLRSSRG